MSGNPDGRRWRPWRVAAICAVTVAVVCGALIGWRSQDGRVSLPQATCGSAVTHLVNGSTQILIADHGALTCFQSAARACKSASIKVTAMNMDVGIDYVFSIEPGGMACQVTEFSQTYSANFGGSHGPVVTTSCRLVAVTERGVSLGCGGQTILIPAAVTKPVAPA